MSKSKLKVLSIVGTRPEIIRLAAVIKLLEAHVDHKMVHTGQNYDYELNQIFFEDLGLRRVTTNGCEIVELPTTHESVACDYSEHY